MRKVILIVASVAGAAVIAVAVYLSQLGLSAPSEQPESPSVVTETPAPEGTQAPSEEEKSPDEENNGQTGKPGEVKP